MLTLLSSSVLADGLRFALVAKSVSDPNFIQAWQACAQGAEAEGNRCDLLGNDHAANAHLQRAAIEEAISGKQYDAIAISVTNSAFIAPALAQAGIPVLTFDSPFSSRENYLSRGYVGPDNLAFGRDLANLAQHYLPNGGDLCIMTVAHDPNLTLRVQAVRDTLAGLSLNAGQRLNGENGWYEKERCPMLSIADDATALTKLKGILSDIRPDAVISVGHWPVVDPAAYRVSTNNYSDRLLTGKTRVIAGVGRVTDSLRVLLTDHLVHGLVSIDFEEIGHATYRRLKEASAGEIIPPITYTENLIISAGDTISEDTDSVTAPAD